MSAYASIYRVAICEALRVELQLAIATIESATHVACDRTGKVWCYGALHEAEAYADGLRGFVVRKMTRDDKEVQIAHKVRVYR